MADLIKYEDSLRQGTDKLNNAIKAFNETVVEGDSSVEAAQARVDSEGNTYNTLKERLDDKETEFSSQLAKIPQQIDNAVLSAKSDITNYLDNQLSQIGNMSPRGAFTTLQDLENAYPNGAEGVYIIQSDGNWYFWNGSNWVVGGTYQAQPWDEFMTEQNEEWVI